MKLQIIFPKWPDNSLWGQIYFRFPYLALTSLAALTHDAWEVSILDEWRDRKPKTQIVAIGSRGNINGEELSALFDACTLENAIKAR